MRILIDTDVLLDVALNRKPFVKDSAGVLRWAERGGNACIAWHSIANCAYLLDGEGRTFLGGLLSFVEVARVGSEEARQALDLPMKDLEDALQVVSAQAWRAQRIVTRNLGDYRNSPILAVAPPAFVEWMKAE
jgi:predicted nucleic acid-binding protein